MFCRPLREIRAAAFHISGVNLEPQWFGRRWLWESVWTGQVSKIVRYPLAVVVGTSEMPRTACIPAVHNHLNVSRVGGDGGGGGRRGCWAGFLHTAEDRRWNGSSIRWPRCLAGYVVGAQRLLPARLKIDT